MSFPTDPLRPGQRIAVVGWSGSGKSYLTKWIILRASAMRWIILDTKHDPIFDDWHPHDGLVDAKTLGRYWRKHPRVVLRPKPNESGARVLDLWLEMIHEAFNNFGVLIDEVYQVAPMGKPPGPGFTALVTRGRVRKQSVIMGSQRPAWVPKFMFSEAMGYCILRLALEDDRKRVASMVSDRFQSMVMTPLAPRQWYYYDIAGDRMTRFNPATIVKTDLDIPTRNRLVAGHMPETRPG